MTGPRTEWARQEAAKIIDDLGISSAPVRIEKILKSKNIILQYAPLGPELSGMAYIKDGIGIIGVNALHHPNRQRFSIAHELGHHILHSSTLRAGVHVDKEFRVLLRDTVTSLGIDPLEIEANAFASEILMPQRFLADALSVAGLDIEDEEGVNALAKKFRVSASAIRVRLAGKL